MCCVVRVDSRSGRKRGLVRRKLYCEGMYFVRILVSDVGSFYNVGSKLGCRYIVIFG